jgi:molybdate transport system regulatory protein
MGGSCYLHGLLLHQLVQKKYLAFRYSLDYITNMNRKKAHPHRDLKPSPGLRGRIWIDSNEGTFLAYGRIILLERIREQGSITKAARSMEMSYRHAWELVDSMNRQSPVALIEASTGGKGGGGAKLTEAGEQAISLFWNLYADFQNFLGKEAKVLGLSASRNRGPGKDEYESVGPRRGK